MKDLVLREMNYDDLPRVMVVEKEVFSDPWQQEMFLQEIENDNAFLLETKEDKKLIGYICGLQILDEYMITNIAVAKNEQHKGYGKMLLDFLLKLIEREGCKTCYLEVRAGNYQAVSFYLDHGFETIGRRKEYYRYPTEDALVMKLNLSSNNGGNDR